MNRPNQKIYFEELQKKVVDTGLCCGCAACVAACARGALSYENERPVLAGECNGCGICSKSCYRLRPAAGAIQRMLFGREINWDEEPYGPFKKIVAVKNTAPEAAGRCQDGGGVTGLLQWALSSGQVRGALVAGRRADQPLLPEPRLVTGAGDLWSCAGTCYTYSPNLLPLGHKKSDLPDELALVGTPCQINAYRQWQANNVKNPARRIKLAIALFCTEIFTPALLWEKLAGELGIPLNKVIKLDIKGKLLIHLAGGEVREVPLPEAQMYARRACGYCDDFSGRFADISAGGIGAGGWTVTVARSEAGERLLDAAVEAGRLEARPVEEFPVSLKLLDRMSRKQLSRPRR